MATELESYYHVRKAHSSFSFFDENKGSEGRNNVVVSKYTEGRYLGEKPHTKQSSVRLELTGEIPFKGTRYVSTHAENFVEDHYKHLLNAGSHLEAIVKNFQFGDSEDSVEFHTFLSNKLKLGVRREKPSNKIEWYLESKEGDEVLRFKLGNDPWHSFMKEFEKVASA